MVIDFQLPNCRNVWCGRVKPCCATPTPYETVVERWAYPGLIRRAATFCRACGLEVTLEGWPEDEVTL